MIRVTFIFDSQQASPYSPRDFVLKNYLTDRAAKDIKFIKVEQNTGIKDEYPFEELSNNKNGGN